jgi:hypothetical protein
MPIVEARKPLDILNLMSPPEPVPYDNFNSGASRPAMEKQRQIPNPPLSPPISPFTKPSNNISPAPTLTVPVPVKDPILYPATSDVSLSPPQPPLFSPSEAAFRTDARRLVDEHLAARSNVLFQTGASPPQREDYELALYFKSAVMEKFRVDPRGWLRRERELLAADRKMLAARNHANRLPPILPAKTHAVPRPQAVRNSVTKVQKPRQPKPPKPAARNPARASQSGPVRSAIRAVPADDTKPTRTVAPNREDKDFAALPDYCPPVESLPDRANSLKVEWKGNLLDLSHDAFRHLLHPDELSLASSLRLDCATYLTSKRRIFIRRLECARIGKEFRKTDAQQACKIDVNKASKLWSAYEKVGWLNLHWMKPFLAQNPAPVLH